MIQMSNLRANLIPLNLNLHKVSVQEGERFKGYVLILSAITHLCAINLNASNVAKSTLIVLLLLFLE